ncbi:L,D-transpeptidase family protein [Streptomyces caniscabiei]|uniref:L,D-transpeptidase family protein n=1 Tax=Streptomyces caniscabiei TaxID=2746961 RepID=A0ABU4N099_9ACTN|nr:L,D-transpeptidase family protein [Streptomyces caniscabiei]MBE4737266.1 L,D-transpeptidase family protein [Streptomyces caniscabiei]MBE4756026.1 L,D-transpeptidase family protein [Streptomyces caniscabiei]MBE4769956.1 L,D-transpeptidase family protein [Streptomyces caniscabiei]MBE4787097.1 L,D-transpeptidase family protein [Streptomyces caniscabiei]MBE4795498.1 L,D-transpeptidase family protein [Streptomyces caniscabiei]
MRRLPLPAAVLALAVTFTVTLVDRGGPGDEPTRAAPSAAGGHDVQAVAPAPADAGSGPNAAGERGADAEAKARDKAEADAASDAKAKDEAKNKAKDKAGGDARLKAASESAGPSTAAVTDLPGLGPRTLAGIPDDARQVVLVTGKAKNSSDSRVVLYRRTANGWTAGRSWAAHNALRGWTDHHVAGDLHSPVGVFTLSDAGGLLADPGTKLPYDRSGAFTIGGTGFEGEPLAGSFDYVIAIDYNRERGTTPLDWTRPLGADRGGGIWLHVDHGGPTHGCVSLSRQHMKELLLELDPALKPVIVMGDATSLLR